MQRSYPQLSSTLIVSQQQGGDGGTIFVVKNPVTQRFFRFREHEFYVAQQLDGATPPETIRQRVSDRFGASVPLAVVTQFIEQLRRIGLLESDTDKTVLPQKRRGSLLYWRLTSIDADAFLGLLADKLRFMFTPGFVLVSAALIGWALGIVLANGAEIAVDLGGLYNLHSLLLVWVVVMCVIIAHELAHGLTCKHFGGSVHELGVLLLFFQPTLYCNVSDAWLFPEKTKRLWVSFAGAYCELVLWALATACWCVFDPSTPLSSLSLVVMATSGVKSIFNFNPLIKLDGYYLLSDYLEIPNLRQRAGAYWKDRLQHWWGAKHKEVTSIMPRERRIYLIYGLLAMAYSYLLLVGILSWMASTLVGQLQGWGFVLFVALVGMLFRVPITRVFNSHPLRWATGYFCVSSRKRIWKVLPVLGLLCAFLFFYQMELKVDGELKILPVENTDVRAEVEGLIETIHVEEGDWVKKGDLIAHLAERDCRAELKKIAAEIDEKQARLKLLKAGTRAEELELARITLKKTQERLKYAKEKYQLYQNLFDQKLASLKELNETKEALAVRQKEQEEAQGTLTLLLAGNRPEEIEALEAEVARLYANRVYEEDKLQRAKIFSPIDGVITTPKMKEKVGQHVKPGDLIAKVHEMKTVRAEIAVPEKEISEVQLGQVVLIKARAYPSVTFQGSVTAIAPAVSAPEEKDLKPEKTVLVTTQLDNTRLLLKSDMTGHAKILCGPRCVYELITRRLVRFLRVEFWSWW
jgi:multidrug resistance efflux pump